MTDARSNLSEQQIYGLALRRVRERLGLKQAEAAEALRVKAAAWQRYEAGERKLPKEKLEALAAAIGATYEEILAEADAVQGGRPTERSVPTPMVGQPRGSLTIPVWGRVHGGVQGVQPWDQETPIRSLDLSRILGPNSGALELAGESMLPWGEPGEIIIYDRDRYPKRGYGCVIETKGGEYYVKLYERTDGSNLFVKQFNPEETLTFELKDVLGVYAVRLRGD